MACCTISHVIAGRGREGEWGEGGGEGHLRGRFAFALFFSKNLHLRSAWS